MRDALTSKTRAIVWTAAYYLVVVTTAAGQGFVLGYLDSIAYWLAQIAAALPPTYWLIYDAKSRRQFVPHIIQPAIASCWWVVVPIYLISTRKWRGLAYVVVHLLATFILTLAVFYLTVFLFWGPKVFR